jgi:hypothetical protein
MITRGVRLPIIFGLLVISFPVACVCEQLV